MSSKAPASSRFTSRTIAFNIKGSHIRSEESMPSFARHVDVEWNGNLMEGNGTAKAGTGAFSLPVTFPSRINETGDNKTTPEELLAGAHAICFAMVVANTIGKQGGKARRVSVTATVT